MMREWLSFSLLSLSAIFSWWTRWASFLSSWRDAQRSPQKRIDMGAAGFRHGGS